MQLLDACPRLEVHTYWGRYVRAHAGVLRSRMRAGHRLVYGMSGAEPWAARVWARVVTRCCVFLLGVAKQMHVSLSDAVFDFEHTFPLVGRQERPRQAKPTFATTSTGTNTRVVQD